MADAVDAGLRQPFSCCAGIGMGLLRLSAGQAMPQNKGVHGVGIVGVDAAPFRPQIHLPAQFVQRGGVVRGDALAVAARILPEPFPCRLGQIRGFGKPVQRLVLEPAFIAGLLPETDYLAGRDRVAPGFTPGELLLQHRAHLAAHVRMGDGFSQGKRFVALGFQ